MEDSEEEAHINSPESGLGDTDLDEDEEDEDEEDEEDRCCLSDNDQRLLCCVSTL